MDIPKYSTKRFRPLVHFTRKPEKKPTYRLKTLHKPLSTIPDAPHHTRHPAHLAQATATARGALRGVRSRGPGRAPTSAALGSAMPRMARTSSRSKSVWRALRKRINLLLARVELLIECGPKLRKGWSAAEAREVSPPIPRLQKVVWPQRSRNKKHTTMSAIAPS